MNNNKKILTEQRNKMSPEQRVALLKVRLKKVAEDIKFIKKVVKK